MDFSYFGLVGIYRIDLCGNELFSSATGMDIIALDS
jgi:hypothetical protein